MDNEFATEFQNSAFYHILFDNQDVVMIYVAGSRICNVIDERSDYDLIVLTNNEDDDNPNIFLMWKGRKIHWYWRNIDTFMENGNTYPARYYGNLLFGYIHDDCIIYKNEKYADKINDLLNNKRDIAINGAKLFYNAMKPLVERICEKSRIDEFDYTKYLGHLCVTSYYVLNEPIDCDVVLPAKRIRWQPVDEDTNGKIIERLRLLKDFIETKSQQIQVP